MALNFDFRSSKKVDFYAFIDFLGLDDLDAVVLVDEPGTNEDQCVFHRKGHSTTETIIAYNRKDLYTLSIDELASYDDYKLLPYLLDSFCKFITGHPYRVAFPDSETTEMKTLSAYQFYDEDWIQEQIGETIAEVKCVFSLHLPYYFELPINGHAYVTESLLNEYGVDKHSSTPRIYGYIQYLLREDKVLYHDVEERMDALMDDSIEQEVDVPQHESIGTVESWQTDGSITTESFCSQDVALLINIGQRYFAGAKVDGVVLNDLGTIFQEGIGVDKDVDVAIGWYKEAIRNGDHWFAPSSLGDIYRKGWSACGVQLELAFKSYQLGNDPYCHYRIGQAYEEGWTGEPNMELAMRWYKKAKEEGHHLAIKRLNEENF